MEKTIKKAIEAYRQASKSKDEKTCKLLISIFDEDTLRPKDVKERIKTFDDACEELGEAHCFVAEYRASKAISFSPDVLAFLKLRIIVAALNEGWKPQFTKDEYRYYPWFYLYTREQIGKMSEEEKSQLCLWGGFAGYGSHCGLGCSGSDNAFSDSASICGVRLALRNRELAVYCGKQFVEIWKDYLVI